MIGLAPWQMSTVAYLVPVGILCLVLILIEGDR